MIVPDCATVQCHLGECLVRLKDTDRAIAALNRAREMAEQKADKALIAKITELCNELKAPGAPRKD